MAVVDSNIKIFEKTKLRIKALGKKGETYDDIINMLIDFYKKKEVMLRNRETPKGCESVSVQSN